MHASRKLEVLFIFVFISVIVILSIIIIVVSIIIIITIIVDVPEPQVNGKMRGAIQVDKGISQDDAMAAALAELDNVRTQTEGKEIQKVIFVPGRIMNIMVK